MNKRQVLTKSILPLYIFKEKDYSDPYVVLLKKNSRTLMLIGMRHQGNALAQKRLWSFYKKNILLSKHKWTFIVEGVLVNKKIYSETDALGINAAFEKIVKDVTKDGARLEGCEPAQKELIKYAISLGSSKDQIAAWAFLNVIYALIGKKGYLHLKDLAIITNALRAIDKQIGLDIKNKQPDSIYVSIRDSIQKIMRSNLGLPMQLSQLASVRLNRTVIYKVQSPIRPKNRIQLAAVNMNIARDYGIASNLVSISTKYPFVCAFLGLNHVVCQRLLYKKLKYTIVRNS